MQNNIFTLQIHSSKFDLVQYYQNIMSETKLNNDVSFASEFRFQSVLYFWLK